MEHSAVAVSDADTSREKLQLVMASTSMYGSSHDRPPFGCEHFVVRPADSVFVQLESQATFACTVHEPPQQS